jgi:hypothetical protein
MTRTFVLLVALAVAGCGGGRSSSDVENYLRETVEASAQEGISFADASCVHAVGNEWRCVVNFNTTEGPMSARGVATCEDKCLWRVEEISEG